MDDAEKKRIEICGNKINAILKEHDCRLEPMLSFFAGRQSGTVVIVSIKKTEESTTVATTPIIKNTV